MLPKNAAGESIQIQELFQTINTRIYNIKNGFDETPQDFSTKEECISIIRNNFLGFQASLALSHCIASNESVKTVRENSEFFVKQFPYKSLTWENWSEDDFYKSKLQEINEELDYYISSLTNFEKELSERNDQLLSIEGIEKTRFNLTVPQLSYLLRIFFDENEKIIDNSQKTKRNAARNISRVFKSIGSDNLSIDSIMNELYKKDPNEIIFWKEKFVRFLNICKADLEK